MNQFIKPSTHWLSGIGSRLILAALVSVFATTAFAADCKVNDLDKSAEYVGDCDNGLAQGKRKKKPKRYVPEVAQPANASVVSNNQQATAAPITDTPTIPQQAISTSSQLPSLIGNIRNFQANASTNPYWDIGYGVCATTVTNIKISKNEILFSIKKPKNCSFLSLELINGSDVFPMSGLGEEFELNKNGRYKWRNEMENGSVLFSINSDQTLTFTNMHDLKMREPLCSDSNCLNSRNLNTQSSSFAENLIMLEQGLFNDKRTGLVWRRCPLGRVFNKENNFCEGEPTKAAWLDMVILASKDRYAGFNDWRLPTVSELNDLLHEKNIKNENCNIFRDRVKGLFRPLETTSQDESYHWTSNNTTSMYSPTSVDFLVQGFSSCRLFHNALRPHAMRPAVFVRGGLVPDEWKVALSKTSQAKSLFNESKREGDAWWKAVQSGTDDLLRSASGGSSNSSTGEKFEINKDKGQAASWEWFKREMVVRCLQGREKGGLPSVYLLPSGRWKTTYKGEYGTMSDAANAACD